MVDIRYLADDSQDSPFLGHPPWSLPEFIPGCTYTALLPGDVSSLAFLSGVGGLLEFTPGAGFSVSLPGASLTPLQSPT